MSDYSKLLEDIREATETITRELVDAKIGWSMSWDEVGRSRADRDHFAERAEKAEAERDAAIARAEELVKDMQTIKSLLSFANQDACSAASAQANRNAAWHTADKALARITAATGEKDG